MLVFSAGWGRLDKQPMTMPMGIAPPPPPATNHNYHKEKGAGGCTGSMGVGRGWEEMRKGRGRGLGNFEEQKEQAKKTSQFGSANCHLPHVPLQGTVSHRHRQQHEKEKKSTKQTTGWASRMAQAQGRSRGHRVVVGGNGHGF
jgi:hypothetical protein